MVQQTQGGRTQGGSDSKLGRKLAALAGAAGAAAVGQDALAITLTQTANVVAAQGIPGFSYTSPTTILSGTLRPPSTNNGTTAWDIDGNTVNDFLLEKSIFGPSTIYAIFQPLSPAAFVRTVSGGILNLVTNAVVGAAANFASNRDEVTANGTNRLPGWTANTPGYFGFKFGSGGNTRYGWAQMTITPGSPAVGQGFVIQQAYYKNDGTSIAVGAVPVVVPEPSSMALLAVGSAGVAAWRLRRKDRAEAAAADAIQA